MQLGESKTNEAIQDDSDISNPYEEETDPGELSEKEKQRVLGDYIRRKKDRQKKQNKARKQKEPEKRRGDLHDMAPGVPTGPGEGMRSAGAFPSLIIQTEDKDYRGMKREPPKGGPPFVGPPFAGVPGSDPGAWGDPGAGGDPGPGGA